MAYQPYPGSGATLTVGGTTADVVDMEMTLQRKEIETTTTSQLYRTYIAGRYGGTLTVTLAGSGDTSSVTRVVTAAYQSQTARGSSAAFVLTDAGASAGGTAEVYNFSGIIQNAVHSIRQDEQDTVRLEIVVTGQIT
jgi:hypothetical protein